MTRELSLFSRLPRPWLMEEEWERLLGIKPEEMKPFVPSTNVSETEQEYEVTMELPGLKPEEISVEMKEGHLLVRGEKSSEKEEKGKTFHRIERHHGKFQRMIPLELPVKEEEIEAKLEEGVLRIVAPKAEVARPKHVEVKTA